MTAPLPPLLLRGDCLVELARIPDESVDSVVTDPPYGLANTDPAHVVEALTRWAAGDRAFIPTGRGFMGKAWDAFVPPPAVWDEAMRVLKPGGHLLAFAGSRTFDLMALSIRFAGFEIRDSIAWLYGSGFPKSMDVSKAIDKLDAAAVRLERAREFQTWLRRYLTPKQINEATGTDMGHHLTTHPTQPAVATAAIFDMLRPLLPEVPEAIEALVAERTVESENYARRGSTGVHEKVAGVSEWRAKYEGGKVAPAAEKKDVAHTPEAEAWQGWGTALKPAFEPVVVACKPLIGTVAANVLAHGTGALNIDATRIATTDDLSGNANAERVMTNQVYGKGLGVSSGRSAELGGRWPANVALDESQAAALDEQSGTLTSGANPSRRGSDKFRTAYGDFAGHEVETPRRGVDKGGASRFFYVAKAPKSERPVYWRPSCNCETIKPCQSQQRATAESASAAGRSWSTSISGNESTGDESHPDTTSTTSTGTSSTTRSTTSGSSRSSSTSASIQDASSETTVGGSRAGFAESSSQSPPTTGTLVPKGGRSTVAADPATLSEWSETSACANCGAPARRESHATVKPLALMRWLCRLVTPPGGVVVDPFAGSGTTLEAAYLEGFEAIGVEMMPEYWPLVAARIERVTR